MTKKQRAAIERFKWGGPKPQNLPDKECKPTSWWVGTRDFAQSARCEAPRMSNSTFGRTPAPKLAD